MLLVVPREELLAVHARRLDRGEPAGEVGPVLQRLELRLAERVVVGDVRSRMRLGDAEIGEQECHRFGGHRLAAVSVDGQLLTANCLLGAGLADQHIGQRGGFAAGDHPADDVAGIDVQDHVKVVVGPFRWAEQLSYVPRPHLIRPVGDEFGFHLRGMGGLGAALTHLARLAQQPIEGRLRTEVDTVVEQRGPHLGRGHVDEPVAVQHVEDRLLLLGAQGTRLRPFAVRDRRRALRCRADAVPTGVAGLRRAYGDARIPHADAPGEFGDGPVAHGVDLGSVSALSESVPKSACSFACTSTTKRALASSRSNWRFSASRRAIFSACGSRRLRPRGTANPASAPASRALRHSTIWLEYKPSRRNNAPFVPSGAASYSAKIANLYLAVNVRRFALSGTSGSGRSVPASSTRPGSTPPGARSNALTLLVIRESLHPRPRVTNCQWAGASGELGREGCASAKSWVVSRLWRDRATCGGEPAVMTSVAQSGLVFLGLDVSKNAISVGVLPAESDAVAVDRIFSDEESVRRLIGRFPDLGLLRVCYEAGPTGFWLARLLQSMGVSCQVVAPSLIPRLPGDRRRSP